MTHIHSVESNALASPGYDRITRLSRRILGPALDRVHWCKGLTTVSPLVKALGGTGLLARGREVTTLVHRRF